MRYCHACGKPIEDDILFCIYCGTRQEPLTSAEPSPKSGADAYEPEAFEPQPAAFSPEGYQPDPYRTEAYEADAWEAPTPKPVKKKKKKLSRKKRKAMLKLGIGLGAAALLAAVAVILLLTGAIVSLLPHSKAKLKLAEANLFKDVAAYAEDGVALAEKLDMSYELTADISASGTSWGFGSMADTLNNISKVKVSGGIESSRKDLKFRAATEFKGNELLDVIFFLNEDEASLCLSPILDDLYTCRLEDLPRVLGMDEDTELPDSSRIRDARQAKKDMKKAMTVAFKDLFNANVKITKGRTVQLFDEEKTVKGVAVYQIKPTEKEWEKLLTDVYNAAAYKGSYLYNAMEYMLTAQASREDVDDVLETWKDKLPDYAEKLAEREITIEVWMKGSTILRQSVTADEGKYCCGYDAYTSDKDSRFFLFYAEDEEVQPVFDMTCSAARGVASFDADLYVDGDDAIRLSGSGIRLKKTSTLGVPQGEYTASYMGFNVEFDVTPQGKGMDHTFRIQGSYLYLLLGVNEASVNLYTEKGATIKKPRGAETVNVGDMSEKELDRLMEKIEDKLEGIVRKIAN